MLLNISVSTALRPLQAALGNAPLRSFSSSCSRNKQKLVILGSGWGGYELLRKVDKSAYGELIDSPSRTMQLTFLISQTSSWVSSVASRQHTTSS